MSLLALFCPFYHVRTGHSLLSRTCHLGSRQCPHQKVQPVDVLILDFLSLQNHGKFGVYKFSKLEHFVTVVQIDEDIVYLTPKETLRSESC